MIKRIRRTLYRFSASTRLRNRDVAREITRLLDPGSKVLDAGCGDFGLAPFLPTVKVVGLDVVPAPETGENFEFVSGTILAMPFADRSFSVSASVDALEHLPKDRRAAAIDELVRVASDGVVVAFPRGKEARRIDEEYARVLTAHGRPAPGWLSEHLAAAYPEETQVIEAIERAAGAGRRSASVEVHYSEWDTGARLIRATDVWSPKLSLLVDLLMGILAPLLPRPPRERSYRAILVARLH
jgi:SAM-dependent methyltransferase